MPYMEGPFTDAAPEEDLSLDPVGLHSAVRVLASVFQGISIEEDDLRKQIDDERLMEFSMVQIALFSTVVRGLPGRPGDIVSVPTRPPLPASRARTAAATRRVTTAWPLPSIPALFACALSSQWPKLALDFLLAARLVCRNQVAG